MEAKGSYNDFKSPNQFYYQLAESIKSVSEVTARIEERVKTLIERQNNLEDRLDKFIELIDEFNKLSGRVMVLESRNGGKVHQLEEELDKLTSRINRIDIAGSEVDKEKFSKITEDLNNQNNKVNNILNRLDTLEKNDEGWQSKVKHAVGLIIQGIWVIIVCYILYKMGINNLPF